MSTINRFGAVAVLLALFTMGAYPSSEKVVITQEDEAAIKELADSYNRDIREFFKPFPPARTPYSKFKELESFKKLIQFDKKLIPYLIRQLAIKEGRRILVGSALADREIKDCEDLYQYYERQRFKLHQIVVKRIFINEGIFVLAETSVAEELFERKSSAYYVRPYSWLQWWDEHQNEFEFHDVEPIAIDTRYKDFDRPHITTEIRNGLLYMEAWGVTYPMIMERASAEMREKIYIGNYYDRGSSIRIHAVTVKEFLYLTDRFYNIKGRPLPLFSPSYPIHWIAETPPKPLTDHRVPYSWGIMAKKTALTEGESIAATIVTRGTTEIVDPRDPSFSAYGSFRVTDNAGETVLDFLPKTKASPTLPLLKRDKEFFPIDVTFERAKELKKGEYNLVFQYLDNLTGALPFEIYEKGWRDR